LPWGEGRVIAFHVEHPVQPGLLKSVSK
jgi:hypothetical protein